MNTLQRLVLAASLLTLPTAAPALVNMVNLPERNSVQLTIYNSADLTLVKETRALTLRKGLNRLAFSWANTLIDPTSIQFRLLDHENEVDLLDTTFPAGRNDALQWNLQSGLDGRISVEIRYFTSGITWAADYVGITNQGENHLGLTGYVRVYNRSGEDYDHAEVRLVVGTINLVEPIADLAMRPAPQSGPEDEGRTRGLERQSKLQTELLTLDALIVDEKKPDEDREPDKPKQVIKQGLSEYFLFSIEGRETILHGEPMRLLSLKTGEVPLETVYKLTDRIPGDGFTKFYRFKNVKLLDPAGKEKDLPSMENLGLSPLPDGEVRLFSEYANRDLAYRGGTRVAYIPIGDRVEVDVGPDPDLVMSRRLKDRTLSHIVSRQYKRRLDNTYVLYYDLIDYDETFVYEEEIVSGKPVPAQAEIERRFEDDVVLWGNGDRPADWSENRAGAYVDLHGHAGKIEKVDAHHVKYFLDLNPGQKHLVSYSVTCKRRKQGPEINLEKRHEPL